MWQRLRALLPLALLAAPLLLALQLWPGAASGLRFTRARFEQGAWWEPVSSQFVHLSLPHALANAAALLLLAWLLRQGPAVRQQLGLLAGAMGGVALLLVMDAGCAHYAGFSGALHGWLGGALALPREPDRHMCSGPSVKLAGQPLGVDSAPWRRALLGLLTLKVGLELAGVTPSPWDFPVYHPAHAAGLAGGLCAAGLMCWCQFGRA